MRCAADACATPSVRILENLRRAGGGNSDIWEIDTGWAVVSVAGTLMKNYGQSMVVSGGVSQPTVIVVAVEVGNLIKKVTILPAWAHLILWPGEQRVRV